MHHHLDNLAPTERFSARAGNYAKYRPSYPASLIDFMLEEFGLGPGSVVADVGSGTGILSRLLLERQVMVIGVEPNREMREEAEKALRDIAHFRSVDGTAEVTTLADASVDLVAAAQAFHWFDHGRAYCEFRRIAGPTGWAALIWNARKTAASAFMAEYEGIVGKYGSEFARCGGELVSFERLQRIFGAGLQEQTFGNFQDLDWGGMRGRLLSASYMPMEDSAGFEPMMKALRDAFERHQQNGQVRLEYETRLYFGRLS
jgi:SAM-dependent methyltransferase